MRNSNTRDKGRVEVKGIQRLPPVSLPQQVGPFHRSGMRGIWSLRSHPGVQFGARVGTQAALRAQLLVWRGSPILGGVGGAEKGPGFWNSAQGWVLCSELSLMQKRMYWWHVFVFGWKPA